MQNGGVVSRGTGPGAVLEAIRKAKGLTRASLVSATGLSRGTVSLRLDQLEARNLIRVADGRESTGGRPAGFVTFNHESGVALAADVGAEHVAVALTDLNGSLLAERSQAMAAAEGPERILSWLESAFEDLLSEQGLSRSVVRGVGVSLAAPVDQTTGRPNRPPIMPGWDGYDIPGRIEAKFGAPVSVDKDANLMALAEHKLHFEGIQHLIFVKVSTGIGSGIVLSGHLHHGVDGAAGDIGHIPVVGADNAICRCGNRGCLEAVASGEAMAKALTAEGLKADTPLDVVALVQAGSAEAIRIIREGSAKIGEVLVNVVNILNPEIVVIGGDIARTDELLLAGIRSVVYQRSLPLATRKLRIVHARLEDRSGLIGAALMAIDRALAPESIDRLFATE